MIYYFVKYFVKLEALYKCKTLSSFYNIMALQITLSDYTHTHTYSDIYEACRPVYTHTHTYIYMNNFSIHQKLTQHCKSTILQ